MILCGNSLQELKKLEANSIDSVVTDPPYGLSFMGKSWDYDVPQVELWQEVFRVLKPGGYLLAFAGTRTQHRMAVNIEDAGFEIRDMIAWVYGSGFPKSLNIGKAVDKLQGNEREVLEYAVRPDGSKPRTNVTAQSAQFGNSDSNDQRPTKGNSPYEGWGTALKPALEPITVARKPISEKNIAQNVLKWGTGGVNIDGSRVGEEVTVTVRNGNSGAHGRYGKDQRVFTRENPPGRWPANLIHDGSDEVVSLFPDSKSGNGKATEYEKNGGQWGKGKQIRNADFGDSGSAARFFYCAKASKAERNKGLEGFEERGTHRYGAGIGEGKDPDAPSIDTNFHPTVKPVRLMQYLVKLVTPKGGTVLDPFNGSGTTGIACKLEGFDYIGIELDPEYVKISEARIEAWERIGDKQVRLV